MKHALISLLLVFAATHACAQVDPVRQQVTFRPVTTQTDEDGDINRLFITYVTPDGHGEITPDAKPSNDF